METVSFPLLFLIPMLPLAGAAFLALFGAKLERGIVTVVALGSVLGALAVSGISTWVFVRAGVPLEAFGWKWMAVGRFTFDLTLGLDQLGIALILVVTGVGSLIHVYSVEYMSHDASYARYFAYLNFFIFAMSVLVLGRSLTTMFIGWEGVGLASYLLIGFWYSDLEKASAGKKAFITNRIGDFGFIIGILTLVGLFGTADFVQLQESVESISDPNTVLESGIFAGHTIGAVITFACLALFVGATGKSAQIPLYVWLPDAMAGPTPVSALIHAATMVTAGVYMICRLSYLYDLAPFAKEVVAIVGAATALFAATIGLAQNDIKRVLAYSTISQLGYMFLAAGLGAYSAAMFHLVTHAFFKACLFLGSGAVIHALHGEQDMRKMGGLRTEIPVVFWTFAISTLALAGIVPFAGFISKDAILAYAYQENFSLWVLAFAAAGLTAIYMGRLVFLTFFGQLRAKGVHVHSPGPVMTMPLVILAALATVAGLWDLPHPIAHLFHTPEAWFDHFLEPTVGLLRLELPPDLEWGLMFGSVALAIAGLMLGYLIWGKGPSAVLERITRTGLGRFVHAALYGKWFIDEVYDVLIKVLRIGASVFAHVIDPWLIDGLAVKGTGYSVLGTGKLLSKLQTGNVQSYAFMFVVAIAAVILWSVQ